MKEGWCLTFFFGNRQNFFRKQEHQSIEVKALTRHLLDFSMFNEQFQCYLQLQDHTLSLGRATNIGCWIVGGSTETPFANNPIKCNSVMVLKASSDGERCPLLFVTSFRLPSCTYFRNHLLLRFPYGTSNDTVFTVLLFIPSVLPFFSPCPHLTLPFHSSPLSIHNYLSLLPKENHYFTIVPFPIANLYGYMNHSLFVKGLTVYIHI